MRRLCCRCVLHRVIPAMCSDFNIRYVKLHFSLRLTEGTLLPTYKTSALRGGMGEMLLRANCISDRNCDDCGFESECIVRRTMYSKMEIEPGFMSKGDSVGYVLECEDYRAEFREGDELKFNLILFGKTTVYFSQFLNAFYALGVNGLGVNKSRFEIADVRNTLGKPLLKGQNITMADYKVMTAADYIQYRMKQLTAGTGSLPESITMMLQSPLTVKYQGTELRQLNPQALMNTVYRRIYILNCFEGIEMDRYLPEDFPLPEITEQDVHSSRVSRYSFRREQKMIFQGIEGTVELGSLTEKSLKLLLAGELIHIGKNTSFGFGRYHIAG